MNKEITFKKTTYIVLALIIIFFTLSFISYIKEKANILEEKISFCHNKGGITVEPSRITHGARLCMFDYENTYVDYHISTVTNEFWAEASPTFELGDYCFSCWSLVDCRSKHNDILRERGVHC